MTIKKGSKVLINDAFSTRSEDKGKEWIVRSEPWLIGESQAVLLVGSPSAWLLECLEEIEPCERGDTRDE